MFHDDRYQPLWAYRPLWRDAQRITARARSPYEATLRLERWFRSGGNFTYDEQPPRSAGLPPLVDFVERTRAGYCQHFAGAMTVMLRMLGVPARVAVGFTAGTWKGGVWTVTDYQAHAWVEAWFAGYGWLTFDPTPGRGTLSAAYTLASDSADAVAALGTGRFLDFDQALRDTPRRPQVPVAAPVDEKQGIAWWIVALPFVPLAAAGLVVGAKLLRRRTATPPPRPTAARLGSPGGARRRPRRPRPRGRPERDRRDAAADGGAGARDAVRVARHGALRGAVWARRQGRGGGPTLAGRAGSGHRLRPLARTPRDAASERALAPVVPPALDTFGKVRW